MQLDQRQMEIVTRDRRNGNYRARGVAGSGKTLVAAARAVKLASEGYKVLVLTYNITLVDYLKRMARQYAGSDAPVERVTWSNFHRWCVELAGVTWEDLYGFDSEDDRIKEIVRIANQTLDSDQSDHIRYDAIIVDEGQDFNHKWWDTIQKARRDGAELWLVADRAQDLYGHSGWTEHPMYGAGFSGPWMELGSSYRIPDELVPYLQDFALRYMSSNIESTRKLAADESIPAQQMTMRPEFDPVTFGMHWVQTTSGKVVDEAALAFRHMCNSWGSKFQIRPEEIVIITVGHDRGLDIIKAIENAPTASVKFHHVFEPEQNGKRSNQKKFNFSLSNEGPYGSTIRSFKGLESRALLIVADKNGSKVDRREMYVALTRLLKDNRGSLLGFVCTDPTLVETGELWARQKGL